MKRFFFSIFISVLLFSFSSNAQMFEKIKAGELWNEVVDISKQAFTNPKLILVQTVNGPYNFGGFPINVSFDINTGSTELWMYVTVNADDTTKFINTFAAKHKTEGYMLITANNENLNFSGMMSEYLSLPEVFAFDSDSLAAILRANQEFMDFYNNNQPFNNFAIELFVNSKFDEVNKKEPYWFISISTSNIDKGCTVQAITGEMICESESFVNDNVFGQNEDYLIFPNPSNEMVYMNFQEPISNLRIMNIFGETIKEFSSEELNYFNLQKFSYGTSGFASGIYFIIIDNRISKRFVIER